MIIKCLITFILLRIYLIFILIDLPNSMLALMFIVMLFLNIILVSV
jgi:hypothetical protein